MGRGISPDLAASIAYEVYDLCREPTIDDAVSSLNKTFQGRLTFSESNLLKGKTGGPGFIKVRTAFGFVLEGKKQLEGHTFIVFRGTKYLADWLTNNGHAQLETIRDNLYNTIQNHRGYVENDLSPPWEGKGRKANGLMHYIPLWVFAACTMALLVMTYAGFSVWLFQGNEPAIEMMQQLMSVMPAEITEPKAG